MEYTTNRCSVTGFNDMSRDYLNDIRVVQGVPHVSDFASKAGTPLVIDTNTGYAYFLRGKDVLPIQAAPPSAVDAWSDGFDDGFS